MDETPNIEVRKWTEDHSRRGSIATPRPSDGFKVSSTNECPTVPCVPVVPMGLYGLGLIKELDATVL